MKRINTPSPDSFTTLLQRPAEDSGEVKELARQVFEEVRTRGDKALLELTMKYDRTGLEAFRVPEEEIESSASLVDASLREAIRIASENIELFHSHQHINEQVIGTMPGVYCWQKQVPLETVGLYIPGGTAPLFSTVLMLGIPAHVAGCERVVLCTPPSPGGKVHPAILYAARQTGIREVYTLGGIQAIAAMTYGTESIPRVDKIFGPGNKYVTAAKELAVEKGIAIDMPAGPSEVLVVADDTARADYIAADLLSQAEHGPDSQAVLITWSESLVSAVAEEVEKQLRELPRREIAAQALKHSAIVLVGSPDEAAELMNIYAPEHLIVAMDQPDAISEKVKNAGSVFIGHYTPESAGDYASGTNHTLPTYGYARSHSGLTLDSFVKKISFQKISREGLELIGPAIETMASAEKLEGHRKAVTLRRKKS